MSQEEEKLIEEFWEDAKIIFIAFYYTHFIGLKNESDVKDFIEGIILKAYRSGKLAGFEVCADSLDDIANNNSVMNNISSDFRKSYITISKSLREGYKSLIEEEKKKL